MTEQEQFIINNNNKKEQTHFIPFHKIKKWLPIGQKTKTGTPKRPTDHIKEYLNTLDGNKKIDEIDWTPIKKQIEEINNKGNEWKEEPIKESILILLRAGIADAEVYENIKAGNIKIKRTDGKMATIKLDEAKIRSFNWGGNKIKGWIASEEEFQAYPVYKVQDSARVKEHFESSLVNTKDLESSRINAYGNLLWAGAGIIVVLIILFTWLLPQFGINIFGEPQEKNTTNQVQIVDANGTPITIQPQTNTRTLEIDATNLTQEQIDKIKEISGT